jgi:O-antigen/teichoic acid export membrane protein
MLTNFMLTIFIARMLGATQFGAFSLAYVTYGFANNILRGLAIQPLLIRFSGVELPTWRRAVAGCTGTALLMGIVMGACAGVAGWVLGGTSGAAFLALGLALPGLMLQDAWRYSFFAMRYGHHAFVNDGIWAAVQIPLLLFLGFSGHANVFLCILAWGAGALVGAVAGMVQARVVPDLAGTVDWLRRHRDLGPRYVAENTGNNATETFRTYAVSNILGLNAVGYIQAAGTLMGPFKILFYGLSLITMPEAVRILRRAPQRLPLFSLAVSAVLTVLALLWGMTLLLAMPRGLGHLFLGDMWRPTYPLVLPTVIAVLSQCVTMGAMHGLHALGAARRSMRGVLTASAIVLTSAVVGAAIGGTLTSMYCFAAAMWVGTMLMWRQLRHALRESDVITVPTWLAPGFGRRSAGVVRDS